MKLPSNLTMDEELGIPYFPVPSMGINRYIDMKNNRIYPDEVIEELRATLGKQKK